MTEYKLMKVLGLEKVNTFYEPVDIETASQDRPAMEVVTDFHHTRPLVLEAGVSVDEADRLLKKAHVHMKLVVDKDENFLGIVSLSTLESQEALRIAHDRGVTRSELTVEDVMMRRSELHALSYSELQTSSIGDVLNTLRDLGQNHILVLDEDQNRICGVVSASDIARRLHVPVEIMYRATSFVEVVQALAH